MPSCALRVPSTSSDSAFPQQAWLGFVRRGQGTCHAYSTAKRPIQAIQSNSLASVPEFSTVLVLPILLTTMVSFAAQADWLCKEGTATWRKMWAISRRAGRILDQTVRGKSRDCYSGQAGAMQKKRRAQGARLEKQRAQGLEQRRKVLEP